MTGIVQLLLLFAPIFALIALGAVLRRVGWLTPEADSSLLRLGVNLFFPALIFSSVVGNAALHEARNLLWPPLLGFAFVVIGWLASWATGRGIGLERGRGLRTFAFTTGFPNYAYMAIPLVSALFSPAALGVLFVFNVGVEFAIWTVGILLLAGGSLREGWRKLLSPPVLALLAAVALNLLRFDPPGAVRQAVGSLGACAVPLGLLLIGAFLEEHLHDPRALFDLRVTLASSALRLGLLPLALLAAARFLPVSTELRQVAVVQAAMPAGVFTIVLAKHYGGQPLTATQVVLATTALSLVATPLWLQFGLRWLGV